MGWLKLLKNANKPEGIKDAMHMSYQKHLRLALQGRIAVANTPPHFIGLFGALKTRYMVSGMPPSEPILWAELAPFLLMGETVAVEALAEYIVYKEMPSETKESWLKKTINDVLRIQPANDISPWFVAVAGYINQTPWCKLLDPIVADILAKESQKI